MQHKFPREKIPLGEKKVYEVCAHCNLVSLRYASGARRYLGSNNEYLTNAPECVLSKSNDAHLRYGVPVPVESIMEDATVILKVLYDELLPSFGTGTTGMRMAKTFLESKQLL